MKIYKNIFLLFAVLFGLLVADYDSDRSPQIQKDWDRIKKHMKSIHTKCYQFVTPVRQRILEFTPYHVEALHLLQWLTKDKDIAIYRDYLNETLGNGVKVSSFATSMKGLNNVKNSVIMIWLNSSAMFVASSSPIWSLVNMPFIHFGLAVWIHLALPHVKSTMHTMYDY